MPPPSRLLRFSTDMLPEDEHRLKTNSLAEKLTNRFLDILTASGDVPHV